MMEHNRRFWSLIDEARAAASERADDAMAHSLKAALKKLPATDIIAFEVWLDEQLERAYRADLWEAAYVLMGGCSDDMFEYFRAWLIAQGRETFEEALQDPESLADLPIAGDPGMECDFESLLYLPAQVYEEMGYGDLYEALPKRDTPPELVGELSKEHEISAKYPRIAARWG